MYLLHQRRVTKHYFLTISDHSMYFGLLETIAPTAVEVGTEDIFMLISTDSKFSQTYGRLYFIDLVGVKM